MYVDWENIGVFLQNVRNSPQIDDKSRRKGPVVKRSDQT